MPLLRVYERNADGTPPLSEGETVLFRSPATEMYLGEDLQGKGEVFVTSRNVIWLDATKADLGYSMDYPYIVMHAVSRDTSAFPKACLYCHLDTSDDSVSELRFSPDDESTLTAFYDATCDAAALNPGDDADDDEPDGAGDWFFNEDEAEQNLLAHGMGRLTNGDGMNGEGGGSDDMDDDEGEDDEDADME